VTDPYASTGVKEEPVRTCSTSGQEEPLRTCSTGGQEEAERSKDPYTL